MRHQKCEVDNPDDQQFCGECTTQSRPSEKIPTFQTKTLETPSQKLDHGSIITNKYDIIELLGRGGMDHSFRISERTGGSIYSLRHRILPKNLINTKNVLE